MMMDRPDEPGESNFLDEMDEQVLTIVYLLLFGASK